jgi:hypothetical protein
MYEGNGSGREPAGVDERYTVAVNATSLAVVEHRPGAVDVLAAAAWSPTRIGSALLRLHSEFDGGERLRKGPSYATDAKLLMMRLKTMPAVREQLTMQAAKWEMEDAAACAAQVLLWWLDRNCQKCQGRRFQHVPGTPSLSAKACPPRQAGGCGGSGEQRIPGGEDGRKLANFLEDCVSRARQSIKQRLRSGG